MFQSDAVSNLKALCNVVMILAVTMFTAAVNASEFPLDHCESAAVLELNTIFRGQGYEGENTNYFRIDVPRPGIVALEISVPGTSEALPRLGLLASECGRHGSGDFGVVDQSATHMVLAVKTPGTYHFRSGARDPRRWLSDFKLSASFMAAELMEEDFDLVTTNYLRVAASRTDFYEISVAEKAEDPVVVDPDPNSKFVPGGGPLVSIATLRLAGMEKAEDPVVVDPDPNSSLSGRPGAGSTRAELVLVYGQSGRGLEKAEDPVVVDPDPNSKAEDPVVVDPDPNSKAEDPVVVDPDPNSMWTFDPKEGQISHALVTLQGRGMGKAEDPVVVDPDPNSASIGNVESGRGTTRLLTLYDDSAAIDSVSLLSEVAEMIWTAPSKKREFVARIEAPGRTAPRFVNSRLCFMEEADDHSDTSICARALTFGRGAAGEIANSWGDDEDLFTFTLARPATVHISTRGTTDTFGSLYDESSHQLATDDDSGAGANFQIMTTLSPGRYFLRVEGDRAAEGSYEIDLATTGW